MRVGHTGCLPWGGYGGGLGLWRGLLDNIRKSRTDQNKRKNWEGAELMGKGSELLFGDLMI